MTKTRILRLKVSDALREQWKAAARAEGRTLGEWLQAAAELALARGSTR